MGKLRNKSENVGITSHGSAALIKKTQAIKYIQLTKSTSQKLTTIQMGM